MIADSRRILTNVILSGIGVGFGFLQNAFIAKKFGASFYGSFVLYVSVGYLLVHIAKSGVDLLANRLIPPCAARRKSRRLRGILAYIILFSSISLLLTSAGFIGFNSITVLYDWVDYRVMCVLLACATFSTLSCACLQSAGRALASNALQRIARPGLLLCVAAIVSVSSVRAEGLVVFLAIILAVIGCSALTLFFRALGGLIVRRHGALVRCGAWTKMAILMGLTSGCDYFLNQTEVMVIGGVGTLSDAGVYNAALRVAALVQLPAVAFGMYAAPMFSRNWVLGELEAISRLVRTGGAMVFLVSVVLGAVAILGQELVLGFMGPDFVQAKAFLWILVLGRLVNVVGGVSGFLMTMTGQESAAAVIMFIACLLAVPTCLLGYTFWGLAGAAAANLIAAGTWVTAMSFASIKMNRLSPVFFISFRRS